MTVLFKSSNHVTIQSSPNKVTNNKAMKKQFLIFFVHASCQCYLHFQILYELNGQQQYNVVQCSLVRWGQIRVWDDHQPMHRPMHGPACLSSQTPIRPHLTEEHWNYTILLLVTVLLIKQHPIYFCALFRGTLFKSPLDLVKLFLVILTMF